MDTTRDRVAEFRESLAANDLRRCAKDIDELVADIRFNKAIREALRNRADRVRQIADRIKEWD